MAERSDARRRNGRREERPPPAPEELLDRLPPQSQEAERSLLGSVLKYPEIIGDVVLIVRPDDFYKDAHQKIYQAIIDVYDRGHPVDLVTLAEELNQKKYLEDVGSYVYLKELWEVVATGANATYYAQIVRDRAMVRNLIHASTEVLRDAYEQSQPADELVADAERKILQVAQQGTIGQTHKLSDAITEIYKRIDERALGQKAFSGLPTGYADLDELMAGLHNSELTIVAARPSVGKTSFALNLIRNIITGEGEPVFFVSLEQSRTELAERLLCCQARVDSHRMRKGTLTPEDIDRLVEAGGVLQKTRLFLDDAPGQNMLRIAANARRLKQREKIKLVVIDYLQLVEPDNRRDPRQEQVAQISRRLKTLAKELDLPVVALAQVNRSSEDRQDHRPRLSDLRESGCLTGDTLIPLADSGARVAIRDLAGRTGFRVWALDEQDWKIKPATVSHAFSTGRKPVFALQTRLGRRIRATGNHQFRAFDGWRRLDELRVGDYLALPRTLRSGGGGGLHPPPRGSHPPPRGLHPWLLTAAPPGLVQVFCALPFPGVGTPGYWLSPLRGSSAPEGRHSIARGANPSGARVWRNVVILVLSPGGAAFNSQGCKPLGETCQPLVWDPIRSISPAGEEEVFDLTVPGPANFVANDIIAHNSIEQDADNVLMLHRPDRFEPGQHEGIIEVLIAKQRSGPTGEITLAYLKQFMRYEDFAVGTPFDA